MRLTAHAGGTVVVSALVAVALFSAASAAGAPTESCIKVPTSIEDPATGRTLVVIPPDWQEYYPYSERFAAPLPGQTGQHVIDLAAIRFTTDSLVVTDLKGKRRFLPPDTSSFPPGLIKQAFADGATDLFIVQAASPFGQTSLRAWIEKSRIEIVDYIPDMAYLVRLDATTWSMLPNNSAVFWAGLFQPAFRVHPKLDFIIESDPAHDITLMAHFDFVAYRSEGELVDALRGVAEASILNVTRGSRFWLVRFEAKARSARPIVIQPGCLWVERWADRELHNNLSRSSDPITTGRGSTPGPIMDVKDVWDRGIRGEGQIASAADTGLDTGNLATLHWDFGQQGVSTNPLRVIKGYALGRSTWDDPNPNGGHGTHTSGSIVGNGIRSGSTPSTNTYPSASFAGTAPKAQFVFQSVMDRRGGLTGLPIDLNNLFSPPYTDGARVHSNSWGSAAAGDYTTDCQNLDEFAWNYKNMVITFSAGNSGTDATGADGVINTDSIGAPGTAKNCITVGASENYRPDFIYEYPEGDCSGTGFTQQAWGWFNATNFPAAPIYADLMANNANGMGAFSSRGPTNDGRFKPDVTAPGIAIISTRTSVSQQYEQWGICNVPVAQRTYYLTMGGTSMANPLTAGTAVLVRQYYSDGWHPNNSATTNASAVSGDGFDPSAALVKATLINGAWDMNPGQYGSSDPQPEIPPKWDRTASRDLPNNAEGFGRVDLEHSLFPGSGWGDDPARKLEVHDVSPGLRTWVSPEACSTDWTASNVGCQQTTITVSGNGDPLIATLVWTDPYGGISAATELVNNLDLEVTSPSSVRYYPNRKDWTGGTQDTKNNVEQVYVASPASGTWTITVRGTAVPGNGQTGTNTQPYALVISGVLTTCTPPGKPVITSITDADACAQSGIRVAFTGGSGATSHNLVRDGSVVVTGYTSGALYNPGDGSSHTYVVRAVATGGCTTDSDPSSFTDGNATPATPETPAVTDPDICAVSGVHVSWSPASGATAYDLLVDGTTVVLGVTSPHTYVPGDASSHTYQVRGRNVSCTGGWSAAKSGLDRSDCICSTAPTFAGLASVTPLTGNVACGLRLAWSAATSNCPNGPTIVYNVYRRTGSDPFALLAACVTGTSYDDTSPVTGTTYDYYVHAEDSTSFGGGACNGGNEDGNTGTDSGSVANLDETGTQVTSPLTVSNNQATTDFSTAFTVVSPTSATVSYTSGYSSGGGTVDLFGPDDDPYNSGFWTIAGSNQTATHCGHSTNYARINQDQYMTLTNPISTVGYTNIRVVFDWITFNMESGDMLRLDYFNGATWVTNVWNSYDNAAWHCGHSVTLPAGAAGISNLQIRFFSDGNAIQSNERAGVDYVIIRGDGSSGSGTWKDNVRVTLLDPTATETVLKGFGQDDGSPYNVLGSYTVPGTYQLRLEEDAGGTATLTAGSMNVQGTACVPSGAQPIQFLTARAAGDGTQGTVKLEWLNPASSYGLTRICSSTSAYPTDPATCAKVVAGDCKPGDPTCPSNAGSYATHTHTGLANTGATTYYYTAWVNSSTSGTGAWSSPKRVAATPFNAASPNPRKWAYSTGASALAPPGIMPGSIGSGAVFAVSNDRIVHGVDPTSTGGGWLRTSPYSWLPKAMSAPAQHQPPVVPLSSGMWVYLASQDGRVYCVNAHTGATAWATARTDPATDMLQAAPAAFFSEYLPSVPNLLFAGTRNVTAENTLFALSPLTGARVSAFDYTQTGTGAIGIITGIAVDYDTERVYFTSRARSGGSDHTVWCVDVSGSSASYVWSKAVGDIDGGPVLANGRLYAGTNAGTVVALELADNGATMRTYATGDGPVKGYIWPEWGTPNLYFSTTTKVWSLSDPGTGAALTKRWDSGSSVPSPSIPMLLDVEGRVLVGGGDGKLYQIAAATGALAGAAVPLGSTALGTPAYDVVASVLHIGSTSGIVHAVSSPLPESAVETYAGAPRHAAAPSENAAEERAPGQSCATLRVSSGEERLSPFAKGFSATKTIDLTITAALDSKLAGDHVLDLDVFAPDGSLYRTLTVPITTTKRTPQYQDVDGFSEPLVEAVALPDNVLPGQRSVSAALPVAGTDIISSSLYGSWRVRARLDGASTPCSTGGDFTLGR